MNVEHLYLGDVSDNAIDQLRAGNSGVQKLKEADIPLVFAAAREGKSQGAIGRLFGISQSQVSRILSGKRWWYLKKDAA